MSTSRPFFFRPRLAPALLLALAGTSPAWAHQGAPLAPHDLWSAWIWDPWIVGSLAITAGLYGRGARSLWRESAPDRGIRRWEAAAFALGWLSLVVALVSPLHPLGEVLFSAHMIQHEMLMLVAAPLLVLGRPLIAFLWALPMSWRHRLGRWAKWGGVQGGWHVITRPWVAWSIHAVVLWAWHAPGLFQATLRSDGIHSAQHLSFLLSALLFYWSLFHGRQGRIGYGAAVLYVFTTAVHTSALGALLTFAPSVWYPVYKYTTAPWGLTPLEDQQLGGLIMWVPAGVIYLLAGLTLFAGWLRESEGRELPRAGGALRERHITGD